MEVQEGFTEIRILRPVREYVATYSGTKVNVAVEHVTVGCFSTKPDTIVIGYRYTSFVTFRPVVILGICANA